jgi:pimeloyl-ACP methyl ester carboxylesterase
MVLTATKVSVAPGLELDVLKGGSGPPLVWLHGIKHPDPDDPLIAALAKRFEVVAPVLPGKAALEELDPFPTIHDLVLFYDSALDMLGVDRATVAGHSFGGLIAAELAAHCPGRVRGLVLISPLGLWNDDYPVEDLFARPHRQVDELIWQGAASRPEPAEAADPVEAGIAFAHALGGIAKYAWPIPDRGLRGRLYRVKAPTLLMFARADALVPAAYASDFADALSDSRAHPLEGGHMAPYEDPEATVDIIARFAAGLS